ncbi:MAG: DEAD/DEAH box helicase family protein [bacterium]
MMNSTALYVRNRLSLRPPQEESLRILSELATELTLKKGCDLSSELTKVKAKYPTCSDFERNFPSMCFALATGVGKTRLMGAFIAYLYLEKKIRNFFVLAPNLTVYTKLIEDFSNPLNPKYVFPGIGVLAQNAPNIITGDNYDDARHGNLYTDLNINVFNISKINAEARGGAEPRIKRMVEYLGEPYFNYLSNLDDLVILMDESHHYRADRGMAVINELNPILGLELTATPQVERGSNTLKFKNVVYEYSLKKAIDGGFVKIPAVATRKDFNPAQYSDDDLDRIKLEDGIRIHEDTKVALQIYSRDSRKRLVKPFVLVVAKDTQHAGQLKELIESPSFFKGQYAGKVMEIHSGQSGSEKDENIAKLLLLEHPENTIEIVIHVNMLKEGWDVTNLYTIIPLRTAASTTLREQTIGRGLRLPYNGEKTGDPKVDKLTIVSHDRFQEILDAANLSGSIFRRENIIEIDEELTAQKETLTATSPMTRGLQDEQKRIETLADPVEKQKAQLTLETKKQIVSTLNDLNTEIKSVQELSRPEIKQRAMDKFKERIQSASQQSLFVNEMVKEAESHYDEVAREFVLNIIEIPRIIIQQSDKVRSGFHGFTLDTIGLSYRPVSEAILRRSLMDNKEEIIHGVGRITPESLGNLIVSELINYPEIDYDEQSALLFSLANDALSKLKGDLTGDELINVVQYHKREIGAFIYAQMMSSEHFYCDTPVYDEPIVKPFTVIEEHNYSKFTADNVHDYSETITPTRLIPTKIFSGFKKACHTLYKFDSKTEKDFAAILENPNNEVLKWLRPAKNQFQIYWKHNSSRYIPDFVVETPDTIYMVETKKEGDIDTGEVQEKATAADEYCKHATDFTTKHKGKPWKYVIIPHNAVLANMSFRTLAVKYEYKGV